MDYEPFIQTAAELIADFGGSVTLSLASGKKVKADLVFTDQTSDTAPGTASTTQGERFAYCAPVAGLAVGDHVLIGKSDYLITRLSPIAPAPSGPVIAFELELQ